MFASSTHGPDSPETPFERWTVDPAAKAVTRTVIDPESQEFPRPNEALIGKPYRYAYTLALPKVSQPGFVSDTRLFKHDLEQQRREVHEFGPGRVPGEFVFVARPGGSGEDDGWLIGFVVNVDEETTDLVILDAADFEGQPRAIVHIPHRVPPGFHGNWVPA